MEGFNPTPDPKEQMPPKRIEGGFNPSPNIKSSQVKCIYTGTHQLFPTHVLARRRSPGTVVRVRYRFTLHISRSISSFPSTSPCGSGFAGDTVLVYPILCFLSYPHYLPLLPDVRHDVADVRLVLGASILRPVRSRVCCVIPIMPRVPFHLHPTNRCPAVCCRLYQPPAWDFPLLD